MLPLAIDVMSGDQQPREYVAGASRALHDDAGLRVLLVGDTSSSSGLMILREPDLRGDLMLTVLSPQ